MSIRPQSAPLNPLSFIDRIIADIELTPTQYEEAKTSYESVADVLNKPESPIRVWTPRIFPQGSMRLGTTVRPYGQDEFDLDIVCWLAASGKSYTPESVYEWVWKTLGEHGIYREMRERKNRCIRLNYARQFHLDITPAIPDWLPENSSLYVPDREHKQWCSSHPVGFADWFKTSGISMPQYRRSLVAANSRSYALSASVEPLPEYGAFEKTPLQRIVQMLKHDRDKHFQNDQKHRPTSIVVTTLTTRSYNQAVNSPVEDLLEFVVNVVAKLPDYIFAYGEPGSRHFIILNPANESENFAEKWNEHDYAAFNRWHRKVSAALQDIGSTEGRGVDVMLHSLSATFGESRVIKAANALGADTHALHEAKKVKVDRVSGRVGAVGATAAPTIFFGSED